MEGIEEIDKVRRVIELLNEIKDSSYITAIVSFTLGLPYFLHRWYKAQMTGIEKKKKDLELKKEEFEFEQYKKSKKDENKSV